MGLIHVLAEVPPNCWLKSHDGTKLPLAGTELLISIKRCHLSSDFYEYYSVPFTCEEADPPRYDIGADFEFRGHMLISSQEMPTPSNVIKYLRDAPLYGSILDFEPRRPVRDYPLQYFGVEIRLPARWIKSAVRYPCDFFRDKSSHVTFIPVPDWQAQVSSA